MRLYTTLWNIKQKLTIISKIYVNEICIYNNKKQRESNTV